MTEKEKLFREFVKKLETAYCQFYIWETLQNKKFEKIYNNKENGLFWAYTISALLFSYSAELAKLTEKQNKRGNEIVSVFHLL